MIGVDPSVLKSSEAYNALLKPEVRVIASTQYLCGLAYLFAELLPKDTLPPTVFVLMENGSYQPYSVRSLNLTPELYGFYLLPQNPDNRDVKIIFRGTEPSSPSSTLINLEPWGPGMKSFPKEREALFNNLNENLNKHFGDDKPPFTLQVYGHSQGGALSQLFVHELLRQRLINDNFDNITTLKMNVLNSPGVHPQIVKETDSRVVHQRLANKPLEVTANFGMVGGDPVQTTGLDMILVRFPHALAEINLIKVDRDLEGHWIKDLKIEDGIQLYEIIQLIKNTLAGAIGAHPFASYFRLDVDGKIIEDAPYTFYSNKNHAEVPEMLSELLNKKTLLPYIFYAIQEMILDTELLPYAELFIGKAVDWGSLLVGMLSKTPPNTPLPLINKDVPAFLPLKEASSYNSNEEAASVVASSLGFSNRF